jgi:hypothetical protein
MANLASAACGEIDFATADAFRSDLAKSSTSAALRSFTPISRP